MLQDAHSRKVSIPVTATVGDTVVIADTVGAAAGEHWTYVHELIGDLAAAGNLTILAIDQAAGERILAAFTLDTGQGITEQDEPGEDNRPRFELKPGEDFVLRVTGGTFNGACHYSLRY
jgi:hypothetical protein